MFAAKRSLNHPSTTPRPLRMLICGLVLLLISTTCAAIWAYKYNLKDIVPRDKAHCIVCDQPAVRKSGNYTSNELSTTIKIWLCNTCPSPEHFFISHGGNKLGHKLIDKAYSKDPSDHCGPLLALIVIGYMITAYPLSQYIKHNKNNPQNNQ